VRFTEQRNMQTIVELIAAGRLDVKRLISHRFGLEEAQQAYALIEGEKREPYLGIVMRYGRAEAPAAAPRRIEVASRPIDRERIGVSLVGAGNYATRDVAVSATGTGEFVMRSLAGREVAERVARGDGLEAAMTAVMDLLGRDYDADVGLIAVDRHGMPVAKHRTRDMPHAFFTGDAAITARMRVA